MANCSRGRGRLVHAAEPIQQQQQPVPTATEPVMRRWPHPVGETESIPETDATPYYIRCALSYQNQLLADIKTLLQQLVTLCEDAAATENE